MYREGFSPPPNIPVFGDLGTRDLQGAEDLSPSSQVTGPRVIEANLGEGAAGEEFAACRRYGLSLTNKS